MNDNGTWAVFSLTFEVGGDKEIVDGYELCEGPKAPSLKGGLGACSPRKF